MSSSCWRLWTGPGNSGALHRALGSSGKVWTALDRSSKLWVAQERWGDFAEPCEAPKTSELLAATEGAEIVMVTRKSISLRMGRYV